MRIAHERVFTVSVVRSPGRVTVRIPDMPWSTTQHDAAGVLAAWHQYVQTQGQGFDWRLDLAAGQLTRRILLPDAE